MSCQTKVKVYNIQYQSSYVVTYTRIAYMYFIPYLVAKILQQLLHNFTSYHDTLNQLVVPAFKGPGLLQNYLIYNWKLDSQNLWPSFQVLIKYYFHRPSPLAM